MATKIVTKNSSTAGAAPTATDLVQGELAVNVADKRLFTEDNGGSIVELGTNPYNFTANHNGSAKLATTSTGIDVTGTATMDGLSLDNAQYINFKNSSNVSTRSLGINGANTFYIGGIDADIGDILFVDGGTTRASFANGGDISFYEDTGTTPKFFWDASAESLQLSGAGGLEVNPSSGIAAINLTSNNSQTWTIYSPDSSNDLRFKSDSIDYVNIDSSGNVGIGTDSPDTLLNLAGDETAVIRLENTNGSASDGDVVGALQFYKADGSGAGAGVVGQIKMLTQGIGSGGHLTLSTGDASGNDVERLRISSNGLVGIGTSSPVSELDVAGITPTLTIKDTQNKSWTSSDTTLGELAFRISDASGIGAHNVAFVRAVNDITSSSTPSGALSFGVAPNNSNASEAMRIDSSGKVGIGCTPAETLDVKSGNASTYLRLQTSTDTGVYVGNANGQMLMLTGATERMRIDASGNLLVGHTSAEADSSGTTLYQNGQTVHKADGAYALELVRSTSDGEIARFRKDGTTVGSIGAVVGDIVIGTGACGIRFHNGTPAIQPRNSNGNANNDAIDIGLAGNRFKDLYLSGGVYLGGTVAANKLDDYEEGTWTPTVYGTATAGTANYSQRVGTYTKVGNLVYLQAYVIFSSFTGTSEMRISGLPFTPEGGSYENHMGSVMLHNIALPSGTVQINPRATDGQTYLALRVTRDNTSSTSVSCDSAGEIIISVTYRSA